QENPTLDEFGGVKLASNEKEELLLELFPSVAHNFLTNKIEKKYLEEIKAIEEENRQKLMSAKAEYEKLTKEEKRMRLEQGLYNYQRTQNPASEDQKDRTDE
ncbi:MAG: hypothetical protein ACOC4J_04695, partial [Bacteroidota bacterium]